jgi:hypothetical protein
MRFLGNGILIKVLKWSELLATSGKYRFFLEKDLCLI